MSDLVGNPKDRFSYNEAHISVYLSSRLENRINFYPYHAHLSNRCTPIMQTCPCNEHPLTAVKMVIFMLKKCLFFIFVKNINCGYMLHRSH